MMWFTMALVALMLGLIFLSYAQDRAPSDLEWLLGKKVTVVDTPVAPTVSNNGQWSTRSGGGVVEITRTFSSGAQSQTLRYAPPVLGVMCDGRDIHVRIDAQAPLTGRADSPVVLAGKQQVWHKAQGYNLLAPDARTTLKMLLSEKRVLPVALSYADIGVAEVAIDTRGLADAVATLPASCRGL